MSFLEEGAARPGSQEEESAPGDRLGRNECAFRRQIPGKEERGDGMRQAIGHWPSNHLYGALICIVVMVVAAAGLAGCSSSESAATSTPAPTAEPTPAPTTGDTPTSTPGGGLPISSPSQFYSLTVSVSPSGSGTVTLFSWKQSGRRH